MRNGIHRRQGFTLIELLVVMSIIIILMALAAGTYFKIESGQKQKRTEANVGKLASALEQQWKAVEAQIDSDISNNLWQSFTTPNAVVAGVTLTSEQAKVAYRKAVLQREFPTSFAEILNPGAALLPAKQSYKNALAGATAGVSPLNNEKAVCLKLILAESRSGIQPFDSANASTATMVVGSSNPIATTPSFSVYVDGWDQPIWFERCIDLDAGGNGVPTTMATLISSIDLETSRPPNTNGTTWTSAATPVDSQDPHGALINLSIPVLLPTAFDGKNRIPYVVSAGPDKSPWTGDDILSFRMRRQGQKGN